MRETEEYLNDTFGMKTLDEAKKLFFYRDDGEHMTVTQEYINKYLVPLLTGTTPYPTEY